MHGAVCCDGLIPALSLTVSFPASAAGPLLILLLHLPPRGLGSGTLNKTVGAGGTPGCSFALSGLTAGRLPLCKPLAVMDGS